MDRMKTESKGKTLPMPWWATKQSLFTLPSYAKNSDSAFYISITLIIFGIGNRGSLCNMDMVV